MVVQLMVILILSAFRVSNPEDKKLVTEQDTLTFIHVTDPHVCNLTGYHPFFVQKRQHFGNNAKPLSQFFNTIPEKYRSDFVVITGDNIDFYEAQTANGEVLDTQIEQYTRLLDISPVPVYLTLGNHDMASYFVSSDTSYSNNQFHAERARAAWSRNAACFKDGSYYSHVVNIDTKSIRLIFLDNGYYSTEEVTDGVLPFIIDQSQLLWLDDQLKISDSDIEIVFMHIPLPFGKQEGKKILTEQIRTYSSESNFFNLLSVLENNSSTSVILAGHKHINSLNNYIFPNGRQLTQVMTGAFGYDTSNWRVIRITYSNIIVYFPGSSEIEYSISI